MTQKYHDVTLTLCLQANELTTETSHYEEQEQELMMVCVEELCKCYGLQCMKIKHRQ